MHKLGLLIIICVCSFSAKAQTQDTIPTSYQLKEVTISSSRLPFNATDVPMSITLLDSLMINDSNQNLSVKEYLQQVPGVYVQNANNFAQDARISIRGFGAAARFGVRGIKLIVDGIPETTPDGTGQLDNLNLDLISKMEIIRGSASSLYGNASGGAIIVTSDFDFQKNFIKSTSTIGSFGFYSQSFTGGIKSKRTTYNAHVRLFGSDGYRAHSQFKQVNTRLAVNHQFSNKLSAVILAEYVDSPEAQDAGGLTIEETELDFAQARDRNVTLDAGEAITQEKLGASLKWDWSSNKQLNTYVFYNRRTFDGKLPIVPAGGTGIIELERNYVGIGNSLSIKKNKHSIKLGYDLLSQKDQRSRFDNVEGQRGDLGLQQEESFLNFGWYLLDYIELDKWYFSGGVRYDINRLQVDDQFVSNGDDSDEIDMNNWSYQVGVGRVLSPSWQVFVNHSTNFETPALNQLSNRPDNSGGFENLDPATASSFETGIKWKKNDLKGEIVGFITKTKNELVPYELSSQTFYRNTGSTLRKGIELAMNYTSEFWRANLTSTITDFTYDSYIQEGDTLDGFTLAGIPKTWGSLNLVATPTKSWEISLPISFVGSMQADSENTVQVDDYFMLAFTARYKTQFKNIAIEPYFGINNLTNQTYFDNIRINPFGNRFYEPAPGRNFYVGLVLKLF